MKKFLSLLIIPILLTACAKKFGPLYRDAQTSFAQGKYIETIDSINLALPFWKESDGQEQKAQAYQLLGKAYHQLKKIDKAGEAYGKAVELSTNTFDSAYHLGLINLTSNQYAAAVKMFKDALRMKKDDPEVLLGLGNAYYFQQNYTDARVAYQRILDSSPAVREALEQLRVIDDKVKHPPRKNAKPAKPKTNMMYKVKKR